jgi:hypothetical protein
MSACPRPRGSADDELGIQQKALLDAVKKLDAKLRIRPSLGAIRLHELTVEDVRAAVRSWGGPGGHTLARLSSALRYAHAQGLVARNVAALVDAPAAAEKREVPTLGPD